ncbi:IS1634 family transposase [bacterium]|nr:IS1634 family transposase [bacterium]
MAHFHTKIKKGRPYLYVREIARVDGKPKVISQVYIGSPERVASLVSGKATIEEQLKVESFGALWLAEQMDKEFDLAGIIDSIIPRNNREKGPSIGEYFLYAVFNRMVEAVSKNRLIRWYKQTAIQQVRPVDIEELTSKKYWDKWDRVREDDLQKVAKCFFEKLWQLVSPKEECLLFDTTNYYTFMDSTTSSELAQRGKSKEGRSNLRQIGLGLLVERGSRLPLYYTVYPGNLHDSHHFEQIMDEMFAVATGITDTDKPLTVVVDKGMNSEDNFTWIDQHEQLHFITTYSPYFAEDLAQIPLSSFEYVDTKANRRRVAEDKDDDCMLAHRTEREFWGKKRTVVVTYNPITARKKGYVLDNKLAQLKSELLIMRDKVKQDLPKWRDPAAVEKRVERLCKQLHLPKDAYQLSFTPTAAGLSLSIRKNATAVSNKRNSFGRNIIITDNHHWSTSDIIETSLDRWQIEERFRQSKDDDLVGVQPFRHWTDSKIRCHLFTCVVAMTYLRLLEMKLKSADINRTADDVMDDMRHLHSVLSFSNGRRQPHRRLETPSENQAEILAAMGYETDPSGVLQKVSL